MMQFHHRTIWAELNALPCWPDRFEVIVPYCDRFAGSMESPYVSTFRYRIRNTDYYLADTFDVPWKQIVVFTFQKYEDDEYTPSVSAHDVLLEKYRKAMCE